MENLVAPTGIVIIWITLGIFVLKTIGGVR